MFDAFVLAAGFGTRLRPLTDLHPKPLVPVCGVPLLSYALALCGQHDLRRVVVNAHHLPEQLDAWAGHHEGVDVQISEESPDILGTGGGLKKVAADMAERVVVVNGDTLCDVDLGALRRAVPPGGGAMALRPNRVEAETRYGVVEYDDEGIITDLKQLAVAEAVGAVHRDSHFTGIHALDRQMMELVPDGYACIVRTAYIARVPERRVRAVRHGGTWLDVGDPAAYLDTNLAVLDGAVAVPIDPFPRAAVTEGAHGRVWIGADATVKGSVRRSVVGRGAWIPRSAHLVDCVVWDEVEVPPGKWERRVFTHLGPLAVDETEATTV